MRILVVNDDGINAPGIRELVNRMKELGEVVVAAPAQHMSGAGHSVSINKIVKVEKLQFDEEVTGFAVYGTPRDCAELALNALVEGPVDLIVSGINEGCNLTNNVPSSGTCGAACTGLDFGVPSIATSLDFGPEYDFRVAADITLQFARWFLQQPFNRKFALNINIPNLPKDQIKGYRICKNGGVYVFHQDLTPTFDGKYYYYDTTCFHFSYRDKVENLEGDIYALENGYITVSPIDLDEICYPAMGQLKDALEGWKMQ